MQLPNPHAARQLPAPPVFSAIQRMQGCTNCNNSDCLAGEKCGNFGGLIPEQFKIPVGPYKDTKQHSQKGVVEAEHMFSNQMNVAYSKLTGKKKFNYEGMPAFSIDYNVHQQGRYGIGGGVSSTGSSRTSKDYSEKVAQLMFNNPKEAARLLILEEMNAHISQGKLSGDVMSAIVRCVDMVLVQCSITLTQQDKGEILNEMIDYYYSKI